MKVFYVKLPYPLHFRHAPGCHAGAKIENSERYVFPDYQDELEASPEQPMSQWFGLDKEQFPPSDKLTTEQIELMAGEFEQLWAVYSFEPDFPDGLPTKRRYELMRVYLDHPCQHWPGGWVHHFEFCDYDTENCPFGTEFCKCKDFVDDPPEINLTQNDELPF